MNVDFCKFGRTVSLPSGFFILISTKTFMKIINKKVKLSLVGLDGNAFVLLGAFSKQAKKEKWSKEEIGYVLKEAQSSDYDHLLRVLMSYCYDDGCDDFDL